MRYSVCTETVFENVDIVKAMEAVKSCGYDAVEFWLWWEKDVDAIVRAQKALDMDVFAICNKFVEPGNAANHDDYVDALKETMAAAERMGCRTIILQAGWVMDEIPQAVHRKNIIKLYRRVAPMAEKAGMTFVIEPLNKKVNHPTYHLSESQEAFDIIDMVGSPNVKLLFDIYHQQITEGNVIDNIVRNIDKIGHFHMAGNPGRNDIFKGEINYPHVLRAILDAGYTANAGLEYYPDGDACESLRRTREMLERI